MTYEEKRKGTSCNAGEANPRAKLTMKDAQEIRELRKSDKRWSYRRLAAYFDISISQVANVVTGRHWPEEESNG